MKAKEGKGKLGYICKYIYIYIYTFTYIYIYIYILSRCAARITRHRAFSSGTLQLSILIFMSFKPVCEGPLQTRVQKTSSFAVDFPDSAKSES